jgi:hypothetical protein
MTGEKESGTARGYAALQEVRAYWEALRQGSTLPQRKDVDPRGMADALEHVFLLERIGHGLGRFRLAGMHLTQLMGMEVRGMPITALFEPQSRGAIESLLEDTFRLPAIIEIALEAERGIGRPILEGRMILLPVIGDDGTCDRALGCLVTLGEVGRSPRRFAIVRQRTSAIAPSPEADPNTPMPATGFADSAAPYVVPPSNRARGHLRLVKSDD